MEASKTVMTRAAALAVGDVLVNAAGDAYEVAKVARVGRGIRVQYLRRDGSTGRFTAAPDSRVRLSRLGPAALQAG